MHKSNSAGGGGAGGGGEKGDPRPDEFIDGITARSRSGAREVQPARGQTAHSAFKQQQQAGKQQRQRRQQQRPQGRRQQAALCECGCGALTAQCRLRMRHALPAPLAPSHVRASDTSSAALHCTDHTHMETAVSNEPRTLEKLGQGVSQPRAANAREGQLGVGHRCRCSLAISLADSRLSSSKSRKRVSVGRP